MKFTLSWLKRFLETDANITEIANNLTNIGLEVENIIDRRDELKDFEVAYIRGTTEHPKADKLKICEVETKDGSLQIVCGAPNARAGIKVVLARVGTEIPSGKFKIKESEIRSIKSYGMLCSEDELLIGSDGDGIIELPLDAKIGESFIGYYGLDDPVIDINVTPNRGDALGVYGIARDLAAKGIGRLKTLEIPKINAQFDSNFTAEITDKTACPLFLLREIKDVENKESPDWLQKLLKNIGVKTISALVDVTNYMSYSFGQPMHAYDKSKLSGSLRVKVINENIQFKALNGKEYNLESGDLVIKDADNIQAVAGIIGAESSLCDMHTNNIILESAVFNSDDITKTGRRLQVDTDSRYRFERKIDQAFTTNALNIASDLILSICGGTSSSIICHGEPAPRVKHFSFSGEFLTKKTGICLKNQEICDILTKLGFVTSISGDNIELMVPSWRHDINIKEDIVEEIIRIFGYDKIPSVQLPNCDQVRIIPKEQKRISELKRILANRGYDEVLTWSFMDSISAKLFSIKMLDELFLVNPISSDLDYMRPSILPNLLKIASKNLARSMKDLSLFEIGPIFTNPEPEGELIMASGIRLGNDISKNCHINPRKINVFDIKADLETVLSYMGLSIEKCQFGENNLEYYHPTRSTSLMLGKNLIAHFGQIHPKVLKAYDIDCEVVGFELHLANIPFSKSKFGKRDEFIQSDFQITSRDYAFVINEAQRVGEILSYVKNINKKLIKSVDLFDIYSGDKLESGTKSIAFTIQIQADDRTLTEIDLNLISQSIIFGIEQRFYGKLREN